MALDDDATSWRNIGGSVESNMETAKELEALMQLTEKSHEAFCCFPVIHRIEIAGSVIPRWCFTYSYLTYQSFIRLKVDTQLAL